MTGADFRMIVRWTAAMAAITLAAAQTSTMPETRQPREVPILSGRGELLRFDKDLTKVAVAEPKIADAVVISPREVMVNAKSSGRTTVVVWQGDSEPLQSNINVSADTSEFDDFKKTVQASVPGG